MYLLCTFPLTDIMTRHIHTQIGGRHIVPVWILVIGTAILLANPFILLPQLF